MGRIGWCAGAPPINGIFAGKPFDRPQQRLSLLELIGRFLHLAQRLAQRFEHLDPDEMAGRSGLRVKTSRGRHHISDHVWAIALMTSEATTSTG